MILAWAAIVILAGAIVLALLAAPTDGSGHRSLFSSHSIVVLLVTAYVLLPAVNLATNSARYFWAVNYGGWERLTLTVAIASLGLGFFIAGSMAMRTRRHRPDRQTASRTARLSVDSRAYTSDARLNDACKNVTTVDRQFAFGLATAGLLLKLYYVYASGGWSVATGRLSGSVQEYLDLGATPPSLIAVRVLAGVGDAGVTWLLVSAMRDRSRKRCAVWGFAFILMESLSFVTAGKRLALLLPLLTVAFAFSRYIRRITVSKLPLVFAIALGFGMLTLLTRIFLPASQANVDIDLNSVSYSNGSVFAFYFNSLEFSTTEMLSVAFTAPDSVAARFGGWFDALISTNVTPFSYLVPRSLWEGKPTLFTDYSYAVNSLLSGKPLADSPVGYIVTLFGTSYIQGGAIGMCAIFLFFGIVCGNLDRQLGRTHSPIGYIFTYAMGLNLVFHFFRMGSLGWTFLIGITQQIGYLVGVILLVYLARSAVARSTLGVASAPLAQRNGRDLRLRAEERTL